MTLGYSLGPSITLQIHDLNAAIRYPFSTEFPLAFRRLIELKENSFT